MRFPGLKGRLCGDAVRALGATAALLQASTRVSRRPSRLSGENALKVFERVGAPAIVAVAVLPTRLTSVQADMGRGVGEVWRSSLQLLHLLNMAYEPTR